MDKKEEGLSPSGFLDACCTSAELVETYFKNFNLSQLAKVKNERKAGATLMAAQGGMISVMKALLKHSKKGFDINQVDVDGVSPFLIAVVFRKQAMVQFLASKKVDVHQTNNYGMNALHYASWNGDVKMCQYLLSLGVDPFKKNHVGKTPFHNMVNLELKEIIKNVLKNRIQTKAEYFMLNLVEYDFSGLDELDDPCAMTPLESMVALNQKDLIVLPIISALVDWKFDVFGRKSFYMDIFNSFGSLVFFSIMMIRLISRGGTFDNYTILEDFALRSVSEIWMLYVVINFLMREILEYRYSGSLQFPTYLKGESFGYIYNKILFMFFNRTTHPWGSVFEGLSAVEIPRYLTDYWNIFDLSGCIIMLFVAISRITCLFLDREGLFSFLLISHESEKVLIVLGTLILWVKSLSLLELFSEVGILVTMIPSMMKDFINFLAIYGVFFSGFATAFYILVGPAGYSTFFHTMMSLFRATTGDFEILDVMEDAEYSSPVGYLLFIVFVLIGHIMMLNLLIAMLSNSYDVVKYASEKEWRLTKSTYVLRMQRTLGRKYCKNALQASVDLNDAQNERYLQATKFRTSEHVEAIKNPSGSMWITWEEREKSDEREMSAQLLRDEIVDAVSTTSLLVRKDLAFISKQIDRKR